MDDRADLSPDPYASRPLALPAKAGMALAAAAVLMLLASGPGSRAGLWGYGMGLRLFTWAAYLAVAAVAVCLVAAVATRPGTGRRGFAGAVAGFVAAAGIVGLAYSWVQKARGVPPIHDITTDTRNPPAFVAVLPARRVDARNSTAYEGDSVARMQARAYPDIQPLMLALSPDSAFAVALGAAKEMGWQIVDASRQDGRIEATDVTAFFGFKDDVVIRVMPASGIARVDVRSESRVGGSDVGTNAKRIRAYTARLKPYLAVGG